MTDIARILVVDDHDDIRTPLAAYLSRYGLDVVTAADGRTMREQLALRRFDLIVLDIMLPGEDGLSLCRYVHEHLRTPVILLTAMSEQADRVAGLELGADDYVTKPFDPRELVARIRGVLRRMHLQSPASPPVPLTGTHDRYGFEDWILDLGKRELRSKEGQVIELSSMETRLLRVLVEHPNTVLSRERLLDLTQRGDASVFDRSIDSQISRLRKKLELNGRLRRLLRTAWGDGYMFSAEVEVLP